MPRRPYWLLVPVGLAIGTLVVRHVDPGGSPAPAPAATGVLCLEFPSAWAGRAVEVTLRRREGARAAEWLRLQPIVRDDGSLPIAGLPTGDWLVEAAAGEGRALAAEASIDRSRIVPVPMLAPAAPR